MAEQQDSRAAWGDWFDVQYALCRDTEARIGKDSAGKSPAFRAALIFAVIEHMGEMARSCLYLPASDHRPAIPTEARQEVT